MRDGQWSTPTNGAQAMPEWRLQAPSPHPTALLDFPYTSSKTKALRIGDSSLEHKALLSTGHRVATRTPCALAAAGFHPRALHRPRFEHSGQQTMPTREARAPRPVAMSCPLLRPGACGRVALTRDGLPTHHPPPQGIRVAAELDPA